jgi:hypothetical protein
LGRCGSSGGAPAVRVRRRRLAGDVRSCAPGLGFARGLDGELEGDVGNSFRG